jgi:catechol 2,3-dioxygenase-like lactoylglutathione lyase family enzyme
MAAVALASTGGGALSSLETTVLMTVDNTIDALRKATRSMRCGKRVRSGTERQVLDSVRDCRGAQLDALTALRTADRWERSMHSINTAGNDSSRDRETRNLVSISPFFIVKDLQASIAFYRERLGFQLDFQGPEGDAYYAGVTRDGIGIFLKTILPDVLPCPNHTRHPWARWDAYIYTLDPDTLFDEFRQRGVPFVKELSVIDDGLWGFEITDADGYVLAFFHLRDK